MVEFNVVLIKAPVGEQTNEALISLKANCTYVDGDIYIFEGDVEYGLMGDGVCCKILGRGVVPSLGDMNKEELKKLCLDVFECDERIFDGGPQDPSLEWRDKFWFEVGSISDGGRGELTLIPFHRIDSIAQTSSDGIDIATSNNRSYMVALSDKVTAQIQAYKRWMENQLGM